MGTNFFSRIQNRIFLYLFFLIFVPFILILGTSSLLFKKILDTTNEESLLILSRFVSSLSSTGMIQSFDDIRLLANTPEIRNEDVPLETKKEKFMLYKQFHTRIADLTLLDDKGRFLISTDLKRHKDLNTSLCYTKAREGAYSLSDVHVSENPPHTSILFCVPIFNEQGFSTSVLVGEMETSLLSYLINIPDETVASKLFILDFNGTVIFHPDKALVLSTMNAPKLVDAIRQSKNFVEYSYNHQTLMAAITPVKSAGYLDNPRWYLIASKEKSGSYSFFRGELSVVLWFIIGCILLILLVGILISRRIVPPVVHLSNAALRVSEGDFDVKVPVESDDELGELSMVFNRMTRNLREHTIPKRKVDQVVFRKTKDIKEKSKK